MQLCRRVRESPGESGTVRENNVQRDSPVLSGTVRDTVGTRGLLHLLLSPGQSGTVRGTSKSTHVHCQVAHNYGRHYAFYLHDSLCVLSSLSACAQICCPHSQAKRGDDPREAGWCVDLSASLKRRAFFKTSQLPALTTKTKLFNFRLNKLHTGIDLMCCQGFDPTKIKLSMFECSLLRHVAGEQHMQHMQTM